MIWLSSSLCCNRARRTAAEPPDHSAHDHQADRDELSARHDAAEYGAAAGIVPQEFQKIASYAIQDEVGCENLSIEALTREQPGQQHEVRKLDGRFKELSRFEGMTERRPHQLVGDWIIERHTPPRGGGLSPAAARGEAA